MYRGYRNPKTHNEKSQTAVMLHDEAVQECGVRIRGARRPDNMPDDWDDIPRSDYGRREHRRPWRSRKQRAMIAQLKSGQNIVIEEEEDYGYTSLSCDE